MARKTKEETEKTRQNILDAALMVFNRKGYVRSTLNDIAKEAAVTRGAIYWHFRDKIDLFKALSEEIEKSIESRPEDVKKMSFQSLEDIREQILKYLSNFETNDRYRTYYEIVTYKTEYHKDLEPVLAKERSDNRFLMKHIENNLKQLHSQGRIREDLDPVQEGILIVAFVRGLVGLWISDQTAFSLKEMAPVMIDTLLEHLAPETEP